MTTPFVPQDAAARERILTGLGDTLFVEAGAGTGKTTSLVGRVANLVSGGAATLDQIAAITFTEAAAAELRDRIRERLERDAAADSELDSLARERCERGVADLDQAAIQTLHSFAAALLRERPLEAGLPIAFETADAIASQLDFDRAWTDWLDGALAAENLQEPLTLALSLGLNLSNLREIALQFHQNYDLLERAAFADAEDAFTAAAPPAAAQLAAEVGEMERLCGYARLGESDVLYRHTQGVIAVARRLAEMNPTAAETYRLLQKTPVSQSRGRQGDWDTDPKSGVNACKLLKDRLGELQAALREELTAARRRALLLLLRELRDFARNYAATRKAQGKAEYHDLLIWARDLLRDNVAVRDYFRGRFSHLLIDEVQDTDPIQAEIAMFLAEAAAPDTPPAERPRQWDEVIPEPGKLFVVGDPKQSIYRFRRAEVRQLNRLRQRMGGESLQLTQNFRSQRPVIAWVNRLFDSWMGEGSLWQAEYVDLLPRWDGAAELPGKPGVKRLGQALAGSVSIARQEGAQAIAALLSRLPAEQWQVRDTEAAGEQYRAAGYSDVCILMTRRTSLRDLEQALEEADIPYRLEGSSLIFDTQEVQDLLNCLRAIDDPANQVAIAAALRAPAFGCSDLNLLELVNSGGRFDYLAEAPAAVAAIPAGQALAALKEYHQARLWESPALLIERFIRERQLLAAALDHPRPRQQWRRYRFMINQARAFADAGGSSLRQFLSWAERQAAESARVTETPVPEDDEAAVRVMTVHGAKGLEFPIVILTGLDSWSSNRSESVLFDREKGQPEVSLGSGDRAFATAGYAELKEKEQELAEDEAVRLLYVAATRAKDHLVVNMYHPERRNSAAKQIDDLLDSDDAAALWESLNPPPVPAAADAPLTGPDAADIPNPADFMRRREQWRQERQALIAAGSRPQSVAATTLARIAKEAADESAVEEPWRRGRGGTSIGRAVHAVLQSIDLATGAGLAETAQAQATGENIPGRRQEIIALTQAALHSPVVRQAVAAGRFWREVPVAAPLGEGVVEGFIDLLYEREGGLVVVDYKTDAIDAPETAETAQRYRLQGGAYALAAQRATGKPVREVVFLFLRPSKEERLTDVAQLTAEAEQRAAEYLRGGMAP